MMLKFYKRFLLLIFLNSFLPVCVAEVEINNSQNSEVDVTYTLGSGDVLKITVYNQNDMSGEYLVNGNGNISLPLIGNIKVKGLTLGQIEEKIKDQLKPDYLLNPRVNLQVLNYRPFYILGEVTDPKSYPYVDGMTYLNAVAIAGGYTYRAKKGYVYVVRGNDIERKELKLSTDQKVMPGDTIRVDERFF